MAAVTSHQADSPSPLGRLWNRDLATYPKTGPRFYYLGVVVVTTVILYYQLYIGGAVGTQILAGEHMTFLYYVTILVVANAIGAFTSLATGIADRIGRANLVVYGTIVTSLLCLIGVPAAAHSKVAYGVVYSCIGFVEGIILVATPALVRDFSPQTGRATAMGFWTMGPVLGSLVVSEVSSHTLSHYAAWQDQYVIAGIVGLVVAGVALVSLRELNAGMRDQIMVSLQEQTVIEMRSRGLDLSEATKRPYRQMFKVDIMGSALAISLFLLAYYTAVAFFPIYFQTVLGFSAGQANSLDNWYWSFNAISLIVFGVLSDRLAVRKPFMLIGALGSILVSITFLSKATHNNPTFSSVAILLVFIGIWGGAAFGPWMASFTETVERRNPALTATGLAVWGWILRLIVAASFLVLPHLINTVTPLVQDGPQVQAQLNQLTIKYPQLSAELQAHPATFAALAPYPNAAAIPPAILGKALTTVGSTALTQASQPDAAKILKYLGAHAAKVQSAQAKSPHQWQHWLWICVGGQIFFIPMIFVMAGYWRPKEAHADLERREAITLSGAGPVPSDLTSA